MGRGEEALATSQGRPCRFRKEPLWLSGHAKKVGLEARAVTESETEAERLRAQARRALELARAINDPEAALRLKNHAAELLERAAAIERDGES